MRPKSTHKDRYPGLQPFDKGQSSIFFGRDQEKKELFYQICLERTVVLFGKSGLGKSSLLNAGVSPLLEGNGHLPIRIRFSPGSQVSNNSGAENLLLTDFLLSINYQKYQNNILENKENPQLWEYVKATDFNELIDNEIHPDLYNFIEKKKEYNDSPVQQAYDNVQDKFPVIPVFIFDQFEEFFNHPVAHQKEFLQQLSEVIHDESPSRILNWITSIDMEERSNEEIAWHLQPLVKIVFALRSDKLALMQALVPFIPSVLRNRYELKPLTPKQAEQAIKEPAAKDSLGDGYLPPFAFEESTLREIVTELSGTSNEIESSQLQIVCNFIEDRLRKDFYQVAKPLVVNSQVINPEKDFPLILDSFYESQLEKITDPTNRQLARKLIEDDLVIDGIRDSISQNKLMTMHGVDENFLIELLNTRLIREETTSRGSIYELSHDTLVGPVNNSKNERVLAETERKIQLQTLEFAKEAQKKEEELIQKQNQLNEAQKRKVELEILTRQLKSRDRWVFFLIIFAILSGTGYLSYRLTDDLRLTNKDLKQTQNTLTNTTLNNVKTILDDSVFQNAPESTKDSVKLSLLHLINTADSVSQKTDDYRQTKPIDKLIDSLYVKDFRESKINTRGMSSASKIDTLRKTLVKRRHRQLYEKSKDLLQ